jgi:hypothetical protein
VFLRIGAPVPLLSHLLSSERQHPPAFQLVLEALRFGASSRYSVWRGLTLRSTTMARCQRCRLWWSSTRAPKKGHGTVSGRTGLKFLRHQPIGNWYLETVRCGRQRDLQSGGRSMSAFWAAAKPISMTELRREADVPDRE